MQHIVTASLRRLELAAKLLKFQLVAVEFDVDDWYLGEIESVTNKGYKVNFYDATSYFIHGKKYRIWPLKQAPKHDHALTLREVKQLKNPLVELPPAPIFPSLPVFEDESDISLDSVAIEAIRLVSKTATTEIRQQLRKNANKLVDFLVHRAEYVYEKSRTWGDKAREDANFIQEAMVKWLRAKVDATWVK